MKTGLQNISLWFGLLMALVVLSAAGVFAFTDALADRLYGTRRTVFIFILLAYGIYRSFRVYQLFKQSRYE